jgi:hypothetical protein
VVVLSWALASAVRAFIKGYFHVDWPNPWIYHAMINTTLGEEEVIQAILSFLQ